jgi:hypothetical protein
MPLLTWLDKWEELATEALSTPHWLVLTSYPYNLKWKTPGQPKM